MSTWCRGAVAPIWHARVSDREKSPLLIPTKRSSSSIFAKWSAEIQPALSIRERFKFQPSAWQSIFSTALDRSPFRSRVRATRASSSADSPSRRNPSSSGAKVGWSDTNLRISNDLGPGSGRKEISCRLHPLRVAIRCSEDRKKHLPPGLSKNTCQNAEIFVVRPETVS